MSRLHLGVLASLLVFGCGARPVDRVVGSPAGTLAPQETVLQDTTPKADLRMVPPEVYMRTYLELFGGLLPLDAQGKARGAEGNNVFDTWDDYVSALGFPDYRLDIPRQTQTNALMVASFERLGVALCDRAVERDLSMIGKVPAKPGASPPPALAHSASAAPVHSAAPAHSASAHPAHSGPLPVMSAAPPPPPPAAASIFVPLKDRVIFAFDPPPGAMDEAQFAPRFDVLHRTFLGYPAKLAPPEREGRYFELYKDIVANHTKALPKSKFSPDQAGWAAVCYGLIRHPEFQLY